MKKFFEKIFRLPLEGKLSPKVTDEVENTLNEKHLIRQASLTPSPRGEGSRRGFTIVELVIALSVIVIVSGISIGVVAVNNKTYGETIDMIEATNIAENAIECFRYAVNNQGEKTVQELFEGSFEKTFEDDFEFPTPVTAGSDLTYTIVKGDVTVVISIINSYKTIEIHAHNSNDDNLFEDTVPYTVR
ncbi:MAG: type II secretion system protein [Clostridia bacterium]|nr:type II secretion system protein [Clostridia bacterium]